MSHSIVLPTESKDLPQQKPAGILPYDRMLLCITLSLVSIGLVLVCSSSLAIAEHLNKNPFYFVLRHLAYLTAALMAAIIVLRTPLTFWHRFGGPLLLFSIALLSVVWIDGIGRNVNGSTRWLPLGPVTLQVSELAKLFVVVYLANYLVRRNDELRTQLKGFLKPLSLLCIITGLLLLQPDFGAAVVIMATSLCMMFLAGARLWQFLVLSLGVLASMGILAFTASYRLQRLVTFLDPWADPFGSGYQLTQSLIAFGHGSWLGQGLGKSVQKLSYLPEAHTDFVFAVLAEELGLVGVTITILLLVLLFWRAMFIGRRALQLKRPFAAYLAYGIGISLTIQAIINIGVNSGVLPTKGITLPLVSYGGTSLLICAVAVAILLRVDHENRLVNSR